MANVVRGQTKGCGCLRGKHLKGLHQKNTLRYGEASFNRIFGNYKYRAKRKGQGFSLSKEEFRLLVDDVCHYCGSAPKNVSVKPTFNGEYVYNGIDRIDNNKGYVANNCVTCCEVCNTMKNKLSQEASTKK